MSGRVAPKRRTSIEKERKKRRGPPIHRDRKYFEQDGAMVDLPWGLFGAGNLAPRHEPELQSPWGITVRRHGVTKMFADALRPDRDIHLLFKKSSKGLAILFAFYR
jgi:hypothetical protein